MTYLGFRINKHGVHPVKGKIEPLLDAPAPANETQLKSFLGMLNYYHRYLPGIASVLEPLHKWEWAVRQQTDFDEAKRLLCSANFLVHFDPNKELILHCDASPWSGSRTVPRDGG